jgi:hypothetical protein
MAEIQGRVSQVLGAVVDVQFPEANCRIFLMPSVCRVTARKT